MSPPRAFVVAAFAALAAAGCDTGGLLVAEAKDAGSDGGIVVVAGPNVTEIVSGGTVAKNDKFTLVFTMGQPTPNQGPATSPSNRDNGGLVGAMNGK